MTNRQSDALTIYTYLLQHVEVTRAMLLRKVRRSKFRLAQALAQLRADGHDVQTISNYAGLVWYRLVK